MPPGEIPPGGDERAPGDAAMPSSDEEETCELLSSVMIDVQGGLV